MRIPIISLVLMLSLSFLSFAGAQTGGNASESAGKTKTVSSSTSTVSDDGKAEAEGKKSAESDAAKAKEDSIAAADPLNYTRPVYNYSPGGRRDPFESLVQEENKDEKKIKGLFNYEKGSLRGIIRSDDGVYAMAVDGDNYSYVLRENDPVFGGYVTKITDDAVQLHIVKYGRAMTIILRMETAKKTILASEEDESVVRRPGITVSWGADHDSAAVMSVGDVSVPSLDTKMIDEVWFGAGKRSGENADGSSPYLLLSPPDNAEIQLPIALRWTKSPLDSLYTLIISRDKDFRTPLLVKEGIVGSTFLLDSNPVLESGRVFFWKVIALHKSGEKFNSRNVLSFRIK